MRLAVVMAVSLALLLLAGPALAQTGMGYDLSWSTVDGGGGSSGGGPYLLGGTIGQADASGALTGGNYVLAGGFWSGVGAAIPPLPEATPTATPTLVPGITAWGLFALAGLMASVLLWQFVRAMRHKALP